MIELLVVIAIIAILVSMLLPALKKARDIAKGGVCKNNLKQCALGAQNYAIDFADYFPTFLREGAGECTNSQSQDFWYWTCEIGPYLNLPSQRNIDWWNRKWENSIFNCPVQDLTVTLGGATPYLTNINQQGICYGANFFLWCVIKKSSWSPTYACLRVWKAPERKIMFADAYSQDVDNDLGSGCRPYSYMVSRHSKSANIAFIDGHVEPAKSGTVPSASLLNIWWGRDVVP